MAVGSFENPRKVTPGEMTEIEIQNVASTIEGDIISGLGKGMDRGLTDEQLLEAMQAGVKKAYEWLTNK